MRLPSGGAVQRRRMGREDRGAVAIVVAVFVVVMMLLLAFVVDRGIIFVARSQLQNAVDAAALAAAQATCAGQSSAQVRTIAVQYGANNGVTVDPANVIVAQGLVNASGVSVAANIVQDQIFGPFAGVDSAAVAARATAVRSVCIPSYAVFSQTLVLASGSPVVTGDVYAGQRFDIGGSAQVRGSVYAGAERTRPAADADAVVDGHNNVTGDVTAVGTIDVRHDDGVGGSLFPGTGITAYTAEDYADDIGLRARIDAAIADLAKVTVTGDCGPADAGSAPILQCSGEFTATSWPSTLRTVIADTLDIGGSGSLTIGAWPSDPVILYATGVDPSLTSPVRRAIELNGGVTLNGYAYAPDAGLDVEGGSVVNGRAITQNPITVNGNFSTGTAINFENNQDLAARLVQ